MNKIRNSSEGPLQRLGAKVSGPKGLLGTSLLALTTGFAGKVEAATWDTPVAVSAINTSTAHEGYAAPDDSGNLLYTSTSDGITYTTKVLLSGASSPTDVSATGLS